MPRNFRLVGQQEQRIKRLTKNLDAVKRRAQYYQRRCTILEAILANVDVSLVPPKGCTQQERFYERYMTDPTMNDAPDECEAPPSFATKLMQQIDRNSHRAPEGRRWKVAPAMLCYVCFLLGRKAYEYARRFIVLPSKQALMRRFKESTTTWKYSLIDLNNVPAICKLFRRRHGLNDLIDVDVGLGVDE